ncbi:MAG: tRNA (adenosine(37)-N6)-threonylcarbamoyltransferase complex ATPase subunit type 1 TsaE [bacterium]|nr:tRNA (adenosine(37)-N6)-threonylcarbamoyltransferase complex ATPase subunit type 1 TsaE [bacterium]
MKIVSNSLKETQKIASDLADKIAEKGPGKYAAVIALEGELGAGKTTFVQGFAKALGIKRHLTSPTFVLIKSYSLQATHYKLLIHIDAYRLKDYKDLIKLGVDKVVNDSGNIILIEWSDRVKKILPKKYIKVHIDHVSETERLIRIKN